VRRNHVLWIVWIVATLAAGGALASLMFVGGPRDLLLIGETTSAHHQIELACDSCHTAPFYATSKQVNKAMNKACLSCHEDELKVSNDSHPVKKFRDPRNADRLEKLNALYCHTCHAEHVPEVTRPMAVTLPVDYCNACHQDIATERPSHAGLGFETCASAGCHNYHDNTALYEDFLVKHAGVPDFIEKAVQPFAAISRAEHPVLVARSAEDPAEALKAYLTELEDADATDEELYAEVEKRLSAALTAKDAAAPPKHLTKAAVALWDGSAHALAGVNCGGCHAPDVKDQTDVAALSDAWIEAPEREVCADCHKKQARSFVEGKHGMRFHPKLSKPRKAPKDGIEKIAHSLFADEPLTAMTVGESSLPMKADAAHLELGSCNACHKPHEVDLKVAAVDACAGCHDDSHTRAYFGSPHHKLWEAELAGDAPAGSGVTCADCHMPKLEDRRDGFVTTHNQNAYLRPNEKMIRPVCTSCHGLEFSIDALADPELVEGNFNGRPTTHIDSVDWAVRRARKTE